MAGVRPPHRVSKGAGDDRNALEVVMPACYAELVGIYQKPDNIFEPPGQQIGGVMPFETARQNFRYDVTNNLFTGVRPRHRRHA